MTTDELPAHYSLFIQGCVVMMCLHGLTQTILVDNMIYFYLCVQTIQIVNNPDTASDLLYSLCQEWGSLMTLVTITSNLSLVVNASWLVWFVNIGKISALALFAAKSDSIYNIWTRFVMGIYNKYSDQIDRLYAGLVFFLTRQTKPPPSKTINILNQYWNSIHDDWIKTGWVNSESMVPDDVNNL